MKWAPPTIADVLEAKRRIAPYLRPTPLYRYAGIDELLGTEVFVKHENHQPVGAFKVRGGVNLISQLPTEERERGVISHRRETTGSRSRTRRGSSACRRRSACPRTRTP
jgi:threonine dehydratase